MAKRLQELMTTGTEPEVIESEIYSTVIEAVKKNLVATQMLALRIGASGVPGSSVDIVTQDKDSMIAHEVAEGAEVPINLETLSTFNLKPVKYGIRPVITKEMQEDAKWDMIQRNLQESGYTMAKKLDELIMTEVRTGAEANTTNHTVSGGAAITVANIVAAMAFLESDDHVCTDLIIHPELSADIRQIDTFVEADKAGVTDPSKRLIGTVFGMKVWVTTNGTVSGSTYYAYIIDRDHALCLAEKRPITIERYNDVTRDLTGVAVTARWKPRYLRKEACAYVSTT